MYIIRRGSFQIHTLNIVDKQIKRHYLGINYYIISSKEKEKKMQIKMKYINIGNC